MTFDKDTSAGYLVNHVARIFARALTDEIRPLGLAPAPFAILLELWREEGLTQRQLVERLDLEQATVANTLSRMERDGLIERRPMVDDARAQAIHLTAMARALETPATAAASAVNRRLMAAVSSADREHLFRTLRLLIDASR